MAGKQTNGDNNTGSINVGTMNVPLLGNGTALVNTIDGGVGRTTITPLNLFPEIADDAREMSTPAATVGQFPPITPAVVSEGIIQLTTAQYTALQDQMQALLAEINGRTMTRRPPQLGDQGINNGNNPTNVVNPPNAPAATTELVIPANIVVIATAPTMTQNNVVMPREVRQARFSKRLLSEFLKYKVTWEDNAHDWFNQLPEASISTWETFVDLFLAHIQATMTYKLPYTTLANIKQEVGVLLRTDFWKELQARRPELLVEFFAMAESHKIIENSLAKLERGKDKRESPVPRSRSRSPRGKKSRGRSVRRRSP
uniref:Retrotransposon gag domain-containing protein n=1 Tax=Cannabis sativa TaxID=3483 RepID=A0A803Q2T0_CANSA